jgi:two-component system, OmpR family, sensor histidine kinase KdpD
MPTLATPSREAAMRNFRPVSWALGVAASAAVVASETAICWFVLDHRLPDIVMVYLLGVVLVAMRFGHAASLVTAALSVASFDFFFAVPYFSFAVQDKRYILTFAIMLSVGFVISNLTERIRRDAAAATERELSTATLYGMSRDLSVAASSGEILEVAYRHLCAAFGCDVAVLLRADDGRLGRAGTTGGPTFDLDGHVMARADEIFGRGASQMPASGYVLSTGERLLPLRTSTGPLGVVIVRPTGPRALAGPSDLALLGAFVSQIALAVERGLLAEETQRVQLEVQNERLRNALLSSVSHDLRTPLAVIKGAATALLERESELSSTLRHDYLETISDEASRLNQLVYNLLDMTSLEAGALRVHKEWQPLEEVIGVALNRTEEQLAGRPVVIEIAADAALAPFDATLIEHVLINLIENAIKYTPPGTTIEVRTRRVKEGVEVEVADRGPGVPAGEEERIFQKFHRAKQNEGIAGMGLGLTICRGMVAVHGGRIWCEARSGGGASFRFILPCEDIAPPMKVLPEAVGEP